MTLYALIQQKPGQPEKAVQKFESMTEAVLAQVELEVSSEATFRVELCSDEELYPRCGHNRPAHACTYCGGTR